MSFAPGKKSIEIQGYKEVGRGHAMEGDPSSPIVAKTAPIVPAKYNTDTTLMIDVHEGANNGDFSLRR